MIATVSCKEKTPNEGNLCRGPSLEMHNVATTISSIVAERVEGDPSPNKRLEVCTNCQHLYKNCEVVLTPASLCYSHLPEKESSKKDVKKFHPSSPLKPWKARRYEGICRWDEAKQVCTCGATDHHPRTTRARFLGPRFKKMLLIGAACLPFIFLIAYLVLTYI
ncbi:uncharacterized protein [Macrobrachium rosenbergii]|uniref:uncharacterized protein isoform X1 n=1 Tax=Macrobrachium rosenbergii TaxID=79674 RepID=UPI0034D6B2DE